MDNESLYIKALSLMLSAHCGQKDKAGADYRMHPVRVAQRCQSETAKAVALLHDVLEDTDVTAEQLLEAGWDEAIVDIILGVTRLQDETYAEFIERAGENPISREVKIADLRDNLDVTRLPEVTQMDLPRINKYLYSLRYLESGDRTQLEKIQEATEFDLPECIPCGMRYMTVGDKMDEMILDPVSEHGFVKFRWGGFPPWEQDLPDEGDEYFCIGDDGKRVKIALMQVLATGDDCEPFLDEVDELPLVDDCSPYVVTCIHCINIPKEVVPALVSEVSPVEVMGQPDRRLSGEATAEALREIEEAKQK